jgi:hypothetical protein
MDNTRSAPGAGMTRAHGGEVLEHAWTHTQKLLSAKGFLKYADLSLLPAVDLALVDDATRHVVEVALNALPAYKSLTFPSAKSEIFHEFREVRWEPGELAFAEGSPVPNLYVILEGALHREGYVDGKGRHVPGNVLSRGALYGEAALAHAYQTPARVVSENGELEGVATRAFAVSCETFKRIVRARVHRARRLLANVLNVVETFRPAPAESKELLLNALWSGSAARRKGTCVRLSQIRRHTVLPLTLVTVVHTSRYTRTRKTSSICRLSGVITVCYIHHKCPVCPYIALVHSRLTLCFTRRKARLSPGWRLRLGKVRHRYPIPWTSTPRTPGCPPSNRFPKTRRRPGRCTWFWRARCAAFVLTERKRF